MTLSKTKKTESLSEAAAESTRRLLSGAMPGLEIRGAHDSLLA